MKAIHQLATFQNIIAQYPSDQPLSRFLAAFYRQNKQMGSKDRKIASRLLYNYFRLGNILKDESPQQRLIVAEFLVNNQPNSFLNHFKPEWDELVHLPLAEKINIVEAQYPAFHLANICPFLYSLIYILE